MSLARLMSFFCEDFVATHQQQDQALAASCEINAIAGAGMYAQFANAVADRFNVAKVAETRGSDASQDAGFSLRIA